jgi:multidrug efflux system membrane fusion protein
MASMIGKTRFAVLAAAILLAAAATWHWNKSLGSPVGGASPPGVPVKVASAEIRDMPYYVASVGTVQAFNSVLLRARVDGEIRRVAYREGQDVKQGDVLVELDRRPFEAQLNAAVAQQAKDQAQLDNAKIDLGRYELLVKQDSAPRQVLDTTRALVHQLDATVAADVAQVDAARLQVEYATIRSPIDGRTGARLVDVGNIVHATDLTGLVMLTQLRPIFVSFSLPQEILPALRSRQSMRVLGVTALAQGHADVLGEGELTLIDNQIDTATGTIHCKATFPNATLALWPGQFVTARVLLDTLRGAVTVPAAAVQSGPAGQFVYVVQDGVAKLRGIIAGPAVDGIQAISKGVAGGERVVTEGQFQLDDNARVVVK